MIRSAPSISTTGPAGPSRGRKYGSRSASRAARSCSARSCPRTFAKTSMAVGMLLGSASVSVVVRPVSSWRDRREFVELPYRLHSTSPVWVPPLRLERYLFLMRSQNAFFSHGDAQLFLACRDGRVVGRISAHYDDEFNRFHDNRWGMFGFLEFEDAPDILAPLLEAAEGWLRAHGRDHMIGPMDFTMNDESGVMIEGFERMPFIK